MVYSPCSGAGVRCGLLAELQRDLRHLSLSGFSQVDLVGDDLEVFGVVGQ